MELNTNTPSAAILATAAVVGVATAVAGVDVGTLQGEKTFTVSVLFNEDGDHAAGFDIVGKNSIQYRDIIRATSVVAIKRSQTKKQQIDGKTDVGAGQLFDLGEDRNLKIAKAVVVGLPGFVSGGQPLPVNDATLDALFAKFPSWVDKIIAALEVDANFLTV